MTIEDDRRQKHLQDADRVLTDVRAHLEAQDPTGDPTEHDELRALQLLLEVTTAFHNQRNLAQLMTLVLDSVLSFVEADHAVLMLLDDHGEPRFKMGRSYAGDYLAAADVRIASSIVAETLTARDPLVLLDAQTDERFNMRESVMEFALGMVLSAPLRCNDDMLLGLLYIYAGRPLAYYNQHHLNVLTSLADQAAIALKHVRKFETHTG